MVFGHEYLITIKKWLRMGLTKNKFEFEYLANTIMDIL